MTLAPVDAAARPTAMRAGLQIGHLLCTYEVNEWGGGDVHHWERLEAEVLEVAYGLGVELPDLDDQRGVALEKLLEDRLGKDHQVTPMLVEYVCA